MLDRNEICIPKSIFKTMLGIAIALIIFSGNIACGQSEDNNKSLIDQLQSPDLKIRLKAADKIGMAGNPENIPALIKALDIDDSQDEDASIRSSIACVIAGFGPGAFKPLIEALASENESVRTGAAIALGILQNDQAIEPLINALKNGEDAASGALISFGRKSINRLMPLINSKNDSVRSKAITILGLVCDRNCVDRLTTALNDANDEVRCATVDALGEIGDKGPVPLMLDLIKNEKCTFQVIEAFEKIGDTSVIGPLLRLKNQNHRDSIIDAVAHMDTRAVKYLIFLLNDRDPWVRWNSAVILGKIGDRRAVIPLIDTLKDPDLWVRYHAAEALGLLQDRLAVYPLLCLLRDGEYQVRQVAAESLGKLKDNRAIEPLQKLLNDPSDLVSKSAADAIKNLK